MFGIAFNFVPGLFTAVAWGGATSGSPLMHLAFVVALTFTGPKFQQICNILNNFMFWEIFILIELISLINWLWVFTHSPLHSILLSGYLSSPANRAQAKQLYRPLNLLRKL